MRLLKKLILPSQQRAQRCSCGSDISDLNHGCGSLRIWGSGLCLWAFRGVAFPASDSEHWNLTYWELDSLFNVPPAYGLIRIKPLPDGSH